MYQQYIEDNLPRKRVTSLISVKAIVCGYFLFLCKIYIKKKEKKKKEEIDIEVN